MPLKKQTTVLALITATEVMVLAMLDLDGGRPGDRAWWEAPCADTESLGRG